VASYLSDATHDASESSCAMSKRVSFDELSVQLRFTVPVWGDARRSRLAGHLSPSGVPPDGHGESELD